MFCRADWEPCASRGVVEKSVGIFKRAAGGWDEYERCLGELLTLLCLARKMGESNRLEDNVATIRILCGTPYDINQRGMHCQ
jgi:hypothetical protein